MRRDARGGGSRVRMESVFEPEETIDIEAICSRLRKMSGKELLEYGQAGRYMVSPQASYGPTRETVIAQYRETREEWKRRERARRAALRKRPLLAADAGDRRPLRFAIPVLILNDGDTPARA